MPGSAVKMKGNEESDSVEDWLRSLLPDRGLRGSTQQIFNLVASQPGKASYAPATELAQLAQTSVSSLTRAAQKVGYAGWPDFQRDLRARHLAHLSVLEVSDSHRHATSPFQTSVRQDANSLGIVIQNLDEQRITRIANLLAGAQNIFVTAQGSFAAVGHSFVHNIQIAGYPVRELLDRPATIANQVAHMTDRDVLVVCSYWRLYDVAVIAAARAKDRGATVIVLADNIAPDLERSADEVVIIPAEGTSFFPSLTSAMAVQQGIVATLAAVDPAKTRRSLEAVEQSWQEFKLLHRSVPQT